MMDLLNLPPRVDLTKEILFLLIEPPTFRKKEREECLFPSTIQLNEEDDDDDNNRDRFVMIMTVRQSRIYKSGV